MIRRGKLAQEKVNIFRCRQAKQCIPVIQLQGQFKCAENSSFDIPSEPVAKSQCHGLGNQLDFSHKEFQKGSCVEVD